MIPTLLLAALIGQQVYDLDEIVVTATRYPLALQNIAVATMVVDRSKLDAIRATDISEVLTGTAGVDIKDYGTPGAVTSAALRGTPSNGTLILLDGQPLTVATTGMADLSVIDLNAVERIEIVKGSVSSIYGKNTLGGVINFITFKERTQPGLRLIVVPSTTTFDTLLQNTYVSLKTGSPFGKAQAEVSAGYSHSLGWRSNSKCTRYDLQGALAYDVDTWNARAQVYYDDTDFGLPGPLPLVDSLHPVPVFGDSTATSLYDKEYDTSLLGNTEVVWTMSEHTEWIHRLYGSRRKSLYHTQYAGWMGDTIIEDHTYLTYSAGVSSVFLTRFSALDVAIGLDACVDSVSTESRSESSGDTTWNASTYTFGGWCQVTKDIGGMTVMPSVRIDHDKDFGTFLSPGIGVTGALHTALLVKASAGRTFRAPSMNDLYWPLSGNRDLSPEHAWVYELRIETAPVQWMFGALSLFTRDITDRIAWMPDTGSLWKPRNMNALSIAGIDLECTGRIATFLDLSFEGTYLAATQRNNEVVYDYYDWVADTGVTIIREIERDAAFIPCYTLKLSQHIHAPFSIEIDLSEVYVAKTRNYYANYSGYPTVTMDEKIHDPYLVINASITRSFRGVVFFSVGMKNVLDADYATQFGNSIDDLDYPMPARTLFASFRAHY